MGTIQALRVKAMIDEPRDPKILNLPPRDDLRGAFDALQRVLPILLEHTHIQARLRRASYLALIEQGFTEAQALELCRHQ